MKIYDDVEIHTYYILNAVLNKNIYFYKLKLLTFVICLYYKCLQGKVVPANLTRIKR